MVEARMRHLKRKLEADRELHTSYKEVMEGYISKGHAQKASQKTLLEQELEMEIDRTTLWTDSTSVL